jgi:hypothetical protein
MMTEVLFAFSASAEKITPGDKVFHSEMLVANERRLSRRGQPSRYCGPYA